MEHITTYAVDYRGIIRPAILDRTEAERLGLAFLFDGKPCPRCRRVSIRKLRREPRGAECASCRAMRTSRK